MSKDSGMVQPAQTVRKHTEQALLSLSISFVQIEHMAFDNSNSAQRMQLLGTLELSGILEWQDWQSLPPSSEEASQLTNLQDLVVFPHEIHLMLSGTFGPDSDLPMT